MPSTRGSDGAKIYWEETGSGDPLLLGTLKVPTLVIHGETDELEPPENGRILARAIPNVTLVMLPHASHTFFTDQLEAAGDVVLSFLEASGGLTSTVAGAKLLTDRT